MMAHAHHESLETYHSPDYIAIKLMSSNMELTYRRVSSRVWILYDVHIYAYFKSHIHHAIPFHQAP